MSSVLISVITVSCNSADTIANTLNSLQQQTCQNFESIVIDGQSHDGTQDIVKSFGSLVNKFVSEPDRGIYDAMNKGIELARGKYVSFLNSDDRYVPHTVQLLADQKTDADIFYGKMIKERKLNDKIFQRLEIPDLSKMKETMSIFHPSTFARRSLFESNGYFSLKYSLAADYHWLLKGYLQNWHFEYIDEPLSIFNVGGVSNFSCDTYSQAADIHKEMGLSHENMMDQFSVCQRKMRRNRLVAKLAQLPIFKTIYENRVKKRWL